MASIGGGTHPAGVRTDATAARYCSRVPTGTPLRSFPYCAAVTKAFRLLKD